MEKRRGGEEGELERMTGIGEEVGRKGGEEGRSEWGGELGSWEEGKRRGREGEMSTRGEDKKRMGGGGKEEGGWRGGDEEERTKGREEERRRGEEDRGSNPVRGRQFRPPSYDWFSIHSGI